MMKRLFFLVLFIVGGSVYLGQCLSQDYRWEEDHFTSQHHEVVRNKKIELYPNLNLETLAQTVKKEVDLTELQVRQILVLQQVNSHIKLKKTIHKVDKEKHFDRKFLDTLGTCVHHFSRFIFSFRNRKLLAQLNKKDLEARFQMLRIHNEWGNLAKHDHQRDDDSDDEGIENPWRYLSPANVRPLAHQVPLEIKPDVKPTVVVPPVKPAVVAPPVKPAVVAPPVKNLSTEKRIIQNFIIKEYKRNLVTDFIEACPYGTQQYLVINSDISQGTISKLKSPGTYGPLNPSARRFWTWLQSNTVDDLKKKLYLSDQDIKEMAENLNRKG